MGDARALVGSQVRHYRVLRLIGAGGMGAVYLARDVRLGRLVALKLVSEELAGKAEVRAQFETEARATARLAHPNIVTLYDVGEHEDGRPWVALEYVEGRTLSQMLRGGRPPLADALGIALGMARAIGAAHAAGIVHRDLKPSNVLLAADGRPRVADFGIARIAAEAGGGRPEPGPDGEVMFIGTPEYMAPEQWLGRATTASDVWSFGWILVELLTGRHPLRGTSRAELAGAVVSDEPVPEPELLRAVPQEVARLAMQCLNKDPHLRPSAEDLVRALTEVEAATPTPVAEDGSPFRGLSAFQDGDEAIFHGREGDVRAAIERLADRPLLLVIGPSGSGKSSFVEAGVIPRLRAAEPWAVVRLRPGPRPLDALAEGILRVRARTSEPTVEAQLGGDPPTAPTRRAGPDVEPATLRDAGTTELAGGLREAPGLLAALLAELARPPGGDSSCKVLLWVDQLEEVVTVAQSADEAAGFVQALATAASDPSEPVRVVLATRDDYVGRLPWGRWASTALAGAMQLQPLSLPGMREAILRPAARRGYRFDDPSLVDEMMDAVGREEQSLPLLQFALSELWARRDTTRRLLLRAAYDEMGQVLGALAHHADGVVDALPAPARPLVRDLMLRLVTRERTRKACRVDELLDGLPPAAAGVVDRLLEARLLGRRGDTSLVELAHESLIAAWQRLARWIDESDDDYVVLQDLDQAAQQWERRGRRGDDLWRGAALAEATRVLGRARAVPERARGFVDAGLAVEKRARARRRLVAWAFAGTAVIATAASSAAAWQQRERQRESSQAQVRAEEDRAALLVQSAFARHAEGDPAGARALARAALEAKDGLAMRALLALLRGEPQLWNRPVPHILYDVAMSPDGRTAYAASQAGVIDVFDLVAHRRRAIVGHRDQVTAIALTPDGRLLATGGWQGELRITDVATGRGEALDIGGDTIRRIRISADGRWLAAAHGGGRLSFVDLADRRLVRTAELHTRVVLALAIAPDDREVASGGATGQVHLVDPTTGLSRGFHAGPAIGALAYSPDGRWLASAHSDGHVRIFDRGTGALTADRTVERTSLSAVAFAPDGVLIVGTRSGGAVELGPPSWNTIAKVATAGAATAVTCSRDGLTATVVGHFGLLEYRRAAARIRADTPRGPVVMVRWGGDGRTLLSGDAEGILEWDVERGRARRILGGLRAIRGIERLDGGHLLATHETGVAELDLDAGAVIMEHHSAGASWRALVRLPAIGALAIATTGGIELRDGTTGAIRSILTAHEGGARGLTVLPDGGLLSAGYDGVVRRWAPDCSTSASIAVLPGMVSDVECARDGRRAWASSYTGRVVAMDLVSGANRVLAELGHRTYDLAISPDGRWLAAATADRQAVVLDLVAGTRRSLAGHDGEVNVVEFSPDGAWLATGSDDATVRVWATGTGAPRWGVLAPAAASAAPLLLRVGAGSVIASPDGAVVVQRRDGQRELEQRQASPSPVRVLREGPAGTIVVGHQSGLGGVWDPESGRALVVERLHGPVIDASVSGGRVVFQSGLGDRREIDLSILERPYCEVLREVWATQPLVWRDGADSLEPGPADHHCR